MRVKAAFSISYRGSKVKVGPINKLKATTLRQEVSCVSRSHTHGVVVRLEAGASGLVSVQLVSKVLCFGEQEHGFVCGGIYHRGSQDPLSLQGLSLPAGHDEFREWVLTPSVIHY